MQRGRLASAKEDFYPRPPRGGRRAKPQRSVNYENISIHALREEGDEASVTLYFAGDAISIHALREEGDCCSTVSKKATGNFYPRPPRGGRLARFEFTCPDCKNFYPRPPRGGRLAVVEGDGLGLTISIHALREEGDRKATGAKRRGSDFYPRPPRGGRRSPKPSRWKPSNFYPRPPRGGRHGHTDQSMQK